MSARRGEHAGAWRTACTARSRRNALVQSVLRLASGRSQPNARGPLMTAHSGIGLLPHTAHEGSEK